MDWTALWSVIERVSGAFYDPLTFWSAPLVPAVLLEIRRRRERRGPVGAAPRGVRRRSRRRF